MNQRKGFCVMRCKSELMGKYWCPNAIRVNGFYFCPSHMKIHSEVLDWDRLNPGQIYENTQNIALGLYSHRIIQRMIVAMQRNGISDEVSALSHERVRLGFSKTFFDHWDSNNRLLSVPLTHTPRTGVNFHTPRPGLNFAAVNVDVRPVSFTQIPQTYYVDHKNSPYTSTLHGRTSSLVTRKRKNKVISTTPPQPSGLRPASETHANQPQKKHKKSQERRGWDQEEELDVKQKNRRGYMDIIFSNDSTVSFLSKPSEAMVCSTFRVYPLQFVYRHDNGHQDFCRLIPEKTTKKIKEGTFTRGIQTYYLESDATVKFIGKIIDFDDKEVHAVDKLMKMGSLDRCNVIQARIIEVLNRSRNRMTLMPYMDGDLDSKSFELLMDSATPSSRKQYITTIMTSIEEQIKCLNNVNLIYNDIKPPNILYKHDRVTNELQVQLCDLGSCRPRESETFLTTIPCFQKPYPPMKQSELHEWKGRKILNNYVLAERCLWETMDALLFYLFVRFVKQVDDLIWFDPVFMKQFTQESIEWNNQYRELLIQEMPHMQKYIKKRVDEEYMDD